MSLNVNQEHLPRDRARLVVWSNKNGDVNNVRVYLTTLIFSFIFHSFILFYNMALVKYEDMAIASNWSKRDKRAPRHKCEYYTYLIIFIDHLFNHLSNSMMMSSRPARLFPFKYQPFNI